MIHVAYPNTPEWHAARRSGIGASQAAAACGVSEYKSPLDVYRECRGEDSTFTGNAHTRFGLFMEPGIVAMYADEIGKDLVYPLAMHRHADWPFMLATPDAQEDAETGVEIKTIGWRRAGDVLDHGLEESCPDYVLQAQQQMSVMNWQRVNVVLLIEKSLHVYPVERDDEMIGMIAAHEAELWERIVNGDPPPPTRPSDVKHYLQRRTIVGAVVPLTARASDKWGEYERLGREIAALEADRQLLKADVLHEIGDAPAGLLSDGARMIRRKLTQRNGYTVDPAEVLDVRAVKYDGSPIVQPAQAGG